MTIQHADYDAGNVHESKGVSTAVIDNVYIADGEGTGTWKRARQKHVVSLNMVKEITYDFGNLGNLGNFDIFIGGVGFFF